MHLPLVVGGEEEGQGVDRILHLGKAVVVIFCPFRREEDESAIMTDWCTYF